MITLHLANLKASTNGKEILKGISLKLGSGELHILMGPNGSGKSTLAQVVMGHPSYKVNGGQLTVDGKDITKLTPDKRAKMGIFLGFQHPVEVTGVSVFNFLRKAHKVGLSGNQVIRSSGKKNKYPVTRIPGNPNTIGAFRQELLEYASSLNLSDDFLRRSVNEGCSGGEKKRNEILQMMALKPKLAILDEIDSGLDIDGLKLIARAIKQFTVHSPQSSVILITHYARILKYLKPDFVHVMMDGRIVKSGKMSLAKKIEEKGYKAWQTE